MFHADYDGGDSRIHIVEVFFQISARYLFWKRQPGGSHSPNKTLDSHGTAL